MADNKVSLQAITQQALQSIPDFLKRGIDADKLQVVQGKPTQGYDGHAALASIDPDEPNKIVVRDEDAFRQPGAATQILSHELTHRLIANAPPLIQAKFKPIDTNAPYDFDENNLAGKPITNFSQEQIPAMVQTAVAYASDPKINPARKAQIAAQYQPILQQLQQLPQAIISMDQSGQSDKTLNTTPNAPQGQMFDAMADVQPDPQMGAPTQQPSVTQQNGSDDSLYQAMFSPDQSNVAASTPQSNTVASQPNSTTPATPSAQSQSQPTQTSAPDSLYQAMFTGASGGQKSATTPTSGNLSPDASAWSVPIADMGRAIQHTEGPVDPRTNNPGNLRLASGQQGPVDSRGIRIFPTAEAGWQALQHDLEVKQAEHPTWSISKLMNVWSPRGDGANDPDAKTTAAIQFLQKHSNSSNPTANQPVSDPSSDKLYQAMFSGNSGGQDATSTPNIPAKGTIVRVNGHAGVVQDFNQDTGKIVVDWGSTPRLNPFGNAQSNVTEVDPAAVDAAPNQLSSFTAGAALPYQGAVKQIADIDAAHHINSAFSRRQQELSDSQDQSMAARNAHPIAGYGGEAVGTAIPLVASGVPQFAGGVTEGALQELANAGPVAHVLTGAIRKGMKGAVLYEIGKKLGISPSTIAALEAIVGLVG